MDELKPVFRPPIESKDPAERVKIPVAIKELTDPIDKQVAAIAAARRTGLPFCAEFRCSNGKTYVNCYFDMDDFLRELFAHFLGDPQGTVVVHPA